MRIVAFVAVLACGLAWGTVAVSAKEPVPSGLPEADRALIVAITGDEVTFTWESKKGNTYFILYSDRTSKNAQWLAVPDLQNLPGTGKQETVRVKIPNAQSFRYSLRVLVPKSRLRRMFD